MNYLIHGDNDGATRAKLNEIKGGKTAESVRVLAGDPDLILKLRLLNSSLFQSCEMLVIEFFEKRSLVGSLVESLGQTLSRLKFPFPVVVWCAFEIPTPGQLTKRLGQIGFQEIRIKQNPEVFRLVDKFFQRAGGKKDFYDLLLKVCSREEERIFLIQMFVRKIRQLLWQKLKSNSYLSLSGFLKDRLTPGGNFSLPSLRGLYWEFVSLERKLKTGRVDLASGIAVLYEKF